MSSNYPRESLVQFEPSIESGVRPEKQTGANHQMESKPSTEDILNAILPPREWEADSKFYTQYVSHNPAVREDVVTLQKLLDERLASRQARDSGICPIREELHAQTFDEIIRQVTIDCPERGLLLMRVRDELKMTIAAYQTIYQSSVTFGQRKQLKADEGKQDFEDQITFLEKKKSDMENQKIDLLNKRDAILKRIQERKNIDESKMRSDLESLKYQKQHLGHFIKQVNPEFVIPE